MNTTPLADQTLAQLSDWLMNSAIGVYLLAFLAACAEWTFGSTGRIARASAAVARTAQKVQADDQLPIQAENTASGGTATAMLAAAAPTTRRQAPPDGPGAAGDSSRADLLGRISVSFTVLAFLFHLGSIVTRGLAVGRPPWGNMYEFSTAFAFMATGAYLAVLAGRKNVRWLAVPVLLSVLVTLGLAVTVLYVDDAQLVPALHSYWLWIHVSAAIVSGGVFHTGAIVTLLFLGRDHWEANVTAGRDGGRLATVWSRLPSAATLDKLSYRLNVLVFPLWTFAVIAGAVWAEAAWGRYWGWDPKETWAFITWVAYAAYLHARATAGWKGRRAAYLGLVAFAAFVFNYYGVNIFITGLHSYAGVK